MKKDNRKVFAVILGVAAAGLVVDRVLLGDGGLGPESATAATALGSPATPGPNEGSARAPEPAAQQVNAIGQLVDRLKSLEESRHLSPDTVTEAFWFGGVPPKLTAADGTTEPMPPLQAKAEEFKKSHQLHAILRAPGLQAAIVQSERNGRAVKQTLQVGSVIDGFKLVGIAEQRGGRRIAVFNSADADENVVVELEVPLALGPAAGAAATSSESPQAAPAPDR